MRYQAIDFFRGLTIALMIIVNTAGSWVYIYPPLRHADWHGCTPTDLVFPSFMFIIGCSMWFSFEKYGRQWNSELGWKILNRTAALFLIGLLLNQYPFWGKEIGHWRIFGVPQRLGLGYGFAALLVLFLNRKWLIGVSAALLLLYWGLLNWFPFAGGDPYAAETNAVLRLDRWLIGDNHLYKGEGFPFDPEGLLSTIPSIVTVVLGWLSAELLSKRTLQRDLAVRDLLLFGVVLGVVGLAWDLVFPINKKLWTSSYVLYVGGLDMIILAFSVWLFDIAQVKTGTKFFTIFGSNALFAYIFSEVLVITWSSIEWVSNGVKWNVQSWIYQHIFVPIDPHELGSFLFALVYMLVCWLACYVLYRRKIFFRL